MSIINDLSSLSNDEIEDIEKLTLRWLVQATLDFGFDAYDIFYYSPDKVKDVAEDITREIVDRLSGYNLSQRIFGTVDYKKARYIILPNHIVRQALFVDSKAEKVNSTATLQITQTSLEIRQIRSGRIISVQGKLPMIYTHSGDQYLSSTLFLHYCYEDVDHKHLLKEITACCVPNGILQDKYNPTASQGFWIAGRNAPSLGEEFRVRVSFSLLKHLANWRVQRINVDSTRHMLHHTWDN
jgi:hypothetical protein